jgi:hypothetical protein
MYETELYHHGIKGMRWGVRRFQKYDSTLTAKGKKQKELKTARQYEKALNTIQRGISEEKIRQYRNVGFASRRARRAQAKSTAAYRELQKNGETAKYKRLEAAKDRHMKYIAEKQTAINKNVANIKAGKALTEKLIKEAQDKGFSVSSKNKNAAMYYATGSMYVNTYYIVNRDYYTVTKE